MLDATPFALAVIGALAYGCSDFAGGRASIRLPTLAVAAVAQGIAALGVLALVLASGAVLPRQGEAGLAALAGVGHVAGVLFLYHGIAHGRVAIVCPSPLYPASRCRSSAIW